MQKRLENIYDSYHQKVIVWVAAQVAEWQKFRILRNKNVSGTIVKRFDIKASTQPDTQSESVDSSTRKVKKKKKKNA